MGIPEVAGILGGVILSRWFCCVGLFPGEEGWSGRVRTVLETGRLLLPQAGVEVKWHHQPCFPPSLKCLIDSPHV